MGGTVYHFTCAQSDHREHKPKVPKGKSRDAERMKRFPCQGSLYVTILEGREMIIKMKHLHHHIPYFNIGLPDHWKTWIEQNAAQMLPGLVSSMIYCPYYIVQTAVLDVEGNLGQGMRRTSRNKT